VSRQEKEKSAEFGREVDHWCPKEKLYQNEIQGNRGGGGQWGKGEILGKREGWIRKENKPTAASFYFLRDGPKERHNK